MAPTAPADNTTRGEKLLTDLLRGIDYSTDQALNGVTIRSLTADSRQVDKGGLFVCVQGLATDGHAFVAAAAAKGAVAIVANRGRRESLMPPPALPVVWVDDTRKVVGELAAAFYDHPTKGLTLIGLTGTNGKTTTTFILEAIVRAAGGTPGVIGTINYRYAGREVEARFTTPEPLELQRLLREMADNKVTHVIMEVSSHALAMYRIQGLRFDAALFTNLTRDHLDFHPDMESYYQAKKRLFTEYLRERGAAIILLDDDPSGQDSLWGKRLYHELKELRRLEGPVRLSACGLGLSHEVSAYDPVFGLDRTTATLKVKEQRFPLVTNLVGAFNLKNVLGAVGVALGLGISPAVIAQGLAYPIRVPGRLERVEVDPGQGLPTVFVDYAHTPDALENVLTTLRQLQPKRLIVVFGCGGDRDPGKRRMMGAIAGRLSDVAIITADNSRSESTAAIMAEIEKGVVEAGMSAQAEGRFPASTGYAAISSRALAIAAAIELAEERDIVLISGKGHETYQITAKGSVFFDDRLEAAKCLGKRRTVSSVREQGTTGFGYGFALVQNPSWTLEQILAATGGRLAASVQSPLVSDGDEGGETAFRSISTDSRTIEPGDLFLGLSGENFDGLTFATQAVSRGAVGLIVERLPEPLPKVPIVLVRDTLRALGDLAHYRRGLMERLKVVAITGSSGKTTVKEMTATILVRRGRTLKTKGNFNNLVGLPLSLLPINRYHDFAVLELGMNVPGEIARLTEIADPDVACINNIQPAHLAGLGTIEGVARAKGELFAGCGERAILAVNLEDPLVRALARGVKNDRVDFGFRRGATVRATRVVALGQQGLAFTLEVAGGKARVRLRTLGRHNVVNALAAAAMAFAAGAGMNDIVSGLEAFSPGENRFALRRLASGLKVINDSYNANPSSMRAALATVAMIRGGERTVAVLGDMLELGPASQQAHAELGALVAREGFDYLCALGYYAPTLVTAARGAGMAAETAREFTTKEEAAAFIKGLLAAGSLQADDLILVKGSRGMRMEQVIAALEG